MQLSNYKKDFLKDKNILVTGLLEELEELLQ